MKSYREIKAQLNLCYEISVHLDIQDDLTKDKMKKYLSQKIDILLNEIKIVRDSQTIFKSEQD